MTRRIPHTSVATWPGQRPDALWRSFRADDPTGCRVALLGLPDDTGVALNNGRPGAAGGPDAFRAALAGFGECYDAVEVRPLDVRVFDAGDIIPARSTGPTHGAGSLESAMHATHDRVTDAVRALLDLGMIVVCVGGGHDLTFPAVRALAQRAVSPVGGMNIDPHLDVRPTAGSGMPFRALIEGAFVDAERFVEYGTARFVNAREHLEWARERGVTVVPYEKAAEHRSAMNMAFERVSRGVTEPAFVSFDLDAVDAAYAPGVSAVNPMGFTPEQACRLARRAGEHESVRYFDIMELCPTHDDDSGSPASHRVGRTARLAATLFLHFLAGVMERRA